MNLLCNESAIEREWFEELYLHNNLVPKFFFSIPCILKLLEECPQNADVFELARLESSILAFYEGCKRDKELSRYMKDFGILLSSKFSIALVDEYQCLFRKMNEDIVKKENRPVVLIKVI